MGMNIYTIRKEPLKEYDDFNKKHILNYEDKHIGKRYAAGIWCWDCKVPMFDPHDTSIKGTNYEYCRSCGKKRPDYKDMPYNGAMRELGFDKKKPKEHSGIDGASGFIWCIDDHYGLGTSKEEILYSLKDIKEVIDEYGRRMSIKEFHDIFKDVIEEQYVRGEFS